MIDTLATPAEQLVAAQPDFVAAEPGGRAPALAALRRAGLERFAAVGFPSPREESWRSTDIAPIAQTPFRPARASGPAIAAADLAAHRIPGATCLVFVNGRHVAGLSSGPPPPAGLTALGLAEGLARDPERVAPALGRLARLEDNPFVALNAAYLADGAFLHLAAGTVVDQPIQLLFVGLGEAAPVAAFPRNLILAEAHSQATVVEQYIGLAPGYFSCVVTEIALDEGAVLDHYKVQSEHPGAFHVATQALSQARASAFSSHAIHTGGRLVRNDVNARLEGEGADCILNGLYMVHDRQLVDNHMRVEHVAPRCTSHELYKGILEDEARAVFNGLIKVHPGAQKTDAKQTNRNLLLSRSAVANSNPQLEIFADDVKCTHGSTVGQLDEEAVFYLRSRGIGLEAATSILTYAFAQDIVDRVKVPAVRADIAEFLFRRLPQGEVVRDAV